MNLIRSQNTIHMSDSRLIPRMYRELSKHKTTNHQLLKMNGQKIWTGASPKKIMDGKSIQKVLNIVSHQKNAN